MNVRDIHAAEGEERALIEGITDDEGNVGELAVERHLLRVVGDERAVSARHERRVETLKVSVSEKSLQPYAAKKLTA